MPHTLDTAERLVEDLERGLPEIDGWLPETESEE